jgi:hypothetical protein
MGEVRSVRISALKGTVTIKARTVKRAVLNAVLWRELSIFILLEST